MSSLGDGYLVVEVGNKVRQVECPWQTSRSMSVTARQRVSNEVKLG